MPTEMPTGSKTHPLDRLPKFIRRAHPAALIAGAAVVVGLVHAAILVGVGMLTGGARSAPAAAAPAPAAVDTETVAPQDAKNGVLPPDGPAPDQGPFGVDAQSLLDEIRSHSVPLADADAQRLVDVGDRAIARGQPDLSAEDVAIDQDLRYNFPGWSDQQYTDARRCLAEYAERVIARNQGTVPPDSDDHKGN